MNEIQNGDVKAHANIAEREIDVVEALTVIAKNKKLIFGMPLAVMVLAGAISFALPLIFKASTTVLPPQQSQSGAANLLSQLGGAAGAVAGVGGIKNPNDLYVGMLKSRTIADKLIAQYDLKAAYDTDSMEKARRLLAEKTTVTAGKDGLIVIDVEDSDKQRVVKIANSYVEYLVGLTKELAVTEAGQRRLFYEQQLKQSKNDLANAEMALKKALNTSGVISVDSDSRVMLETIGRVRAQISSKEIQLNAMQAFVTSNNQSYKQVQEELSSLRAQLSKLENGKADPAGQNVDGNKAGGLENIKLLRDVKYFQMLYELLSKQYEAARLDEAKDASIIQVLDVAIEPERKFKPKRAVIVLISGGVALCLAIAIALLLEAKRKALQGPAGAAKWENLKSAMRFR